MKVVGIILVVLGALSILGALLAASKGRPTSFGGVMFLVIGAFLISRANRKEEEAEKKKKWAEGNLDKNEL